MFGLIGKEFVYIQVNKAKEALRAYQDDIARILRNLMADMAGLKAQIDGFQVSERVQNVRLTQLALKVDCLVAQNDKKKKGLKCTQSNKRKSKRVLCS